MTNFEMIKSMNIDELAEWLDEYGNFEEAPWMEWFNSNYCKKCDSVKAYAAYLDKDVDISWCELHDKCKFFETDILKDNNIVKMWLENEIN